MDTQVLDEHVKDCPECVDAGHGTMSYCPIAEKILQTPENTAAVNDLMSQSKPSAIQQMNQEADPE